MAFQAPVIPQERQNRKLLEHLEEEKKRLLGVGHTGGGGGGGGGGSGSVSSNPGGTQVSSVVASSSFSVPPNATPAPSGVLPLSMPISTLPPDSTAMTPQQRAALQHAHANSVGYFITQDSSFGNLILPVLPRYSDK
ncbi:SOSS complex subunit C homolog [Pomacea canaliculata]|uniref:SOSS complex subunit C homolog n=1 Tax=Pomacea canaliculata TaxID=400727 RepID=UPI000D73FDEA|nr:SOSS complex subunit C homolog [Pomacea canaliculata]